MLEDKIIDLINKKIDKVITNEEEYELLEYMNNNPTTIKEFETLKHLSEYFSKKEVNSPLELKTDVMQKIQKIHRQKIVTESFVSRTRELIQSLIKPQMTYPFAAGLLAALLVMTVIFNSNGFMNSINPNGLSGTFLFNSSNSVPDEVINKVLPISQAENFISAAYTDAMTVIKINLEHENKVVFRFTINPEIFEFIALERSSHANGVITIDNKIFSIVQTGTGIYTFYFQNRQILPAVIDYQVSTDDIELSDKLYIRQ